MNLTNSSDGAIAQPNVLDTTQVVMRMPLMSPKPPPTPAAPSEPTTDAQPAETESTLLDWRHPIVLQAAIGVGCVAIIVAAYWLLSSFGSGSTTAPNNQIVEGGTVVADSQPALQSPPSAFNEPLDAIADENSFQTLPPGPSLTGPEKDFEQPFNDFRANTPEREPTPIDSIELNPATSTQRPLTRTQPPTTAAFASQPTENGDYPTTSPKRWRYPEYEIRTPTQRSYPPPRFADRNGATPDGPTNSSPPWERR